MTGLERGLLATFAAVALTAAVIGLPFVEDWRARRRFRRRVRRARRDAGRTPDSG